jgi:ABC-type glycerol-3-phosphate transport system substrate-binding protein
MRVIGLATALLVLLAVVAGCGGGGSSSGGAASGTSGGKTVSTTSTTATGSDAHEEEVREAMAMIGDFVQAHAILKQSEKLDKAARATARSGGSETLFEAEVEELSVKTKKAGKLQKKVDFAKFKKSAYLEAERLIEEVGLIGNGCKESSSGWKC